MQVDDFYNFHRGQTCLLVGNGPNLRITPPECFDMPSIGMNTIHLYAGWKPDYYVTVDHRVMREFGKDIEAAYRDIPKFIPEPELDEWQGENFVRFYHHPGGLYLTDIPDEGMTYSNVMHAAMQLALFMGAKTILMIGVQHKPGKAFEHFWGTDHGMKEQPPVDRWMKDYRTLVRAIRAKGVKVLNLSENTCVPEDVLPRGDWRDWR